MERFKIGTLVVVIVLACVVRNVNVGHGFVVIAAGTLIVSITMSIDVSKVILLKG